MIKNTSPMSAAFERLGIAVALLAAMVTGVGLISVFGEPPKAPVAGPPPDQELEPAPVAPGSVAPLVEEFLPQHGPGGDPVRQWADQVAAVVDIPARAIVSYVNADLAMREHQPGCKISWATLAGIGRIESDHGRYGRRLLREDARPSAPIIGVPLNGAPGIRLIPDTDGGALDGDPVHDRAVGPMQFIPSTWRKWATDGNGDGLGDPQNLDDAAMTAARYLCTGSRDLTTGTGWWSGVLSYNNSVEYGQKVFALAESYAEAGNRRR
ncbi:lytic transglycosylase domain-containing protein [Saccharopolyspora phatthalungensis]|uniref:Membrane-bound lytic murein transglycosylase B n=1 Tax=Saccharopolyspora phatthalungensis TaxID=664693 RepID=A0A840Q4C6_9PSEU|nr:lytic murein transglycosylase [Saccharopolyspora phatthalungensis]MBB5153588.1 membrane-bound lytic murein transglycosylase B [Saccharopolyspora phatthalungensis]